MRRILTYINKCGYITKNAKRLFLKGTKQANIKMKKFCTVLVATHVK